jgi:hypothetical protein
LTVCHISFNEDFRWLSEAEASLVRASIVNLKIYYSENSRWLSVVEAGVKAIKTIPPDKNLGSVSPFYAKR